MNRIEELERELAAARARMNTLSEIAGHFEQERDRLREALERYGKHLLGCPPGSTTPIGECSCGYTQALAGGEGE